MADGSGSVIVPVENLMRRGNGHRARTVSIRRLSKRELERGRMEAPEYVTDAYDRPKTRGDCLNGEHAQRPCPFVSCTHHAFLDVDDQTGSIKINHPPADDSDEALAEMLHAMPYTCALDMADDGGDTLDRVGIMLRVSRERCRQLEVQALAKLSALGAELAILAELAEPEPGQ